MTHKLISVLIPNFNRNALLEQTLNSVISQSIGYECLDIIVVDDYSQIEDPLDIISKFSLFGVKLIRNEVNLGQMRNLNKCLSFAKCKYVHILHSDDFIEKSFYAEIIEQFKLHPSAGAVFTRNFFVNNNGFITGVSTLFTENSGEIENWLNNLYCEQLIQAPSVVVKKEIYDKVGKFREDLRTCEDWEMWVRISEVSQVIFHNKVLANYRSTSTSNSSTTTFDGTYVHDWQK